MFLNTRPLHLNAELSKLLIHAHHEALEFPVSELVPHFPERFYDDLERQRGRKMALLFTSRVGIEFFFRGFDQRRASELISSVKMLCLGERIAQVARSNGIQDVFSFASRDGGEFASKLFPFCRDEGVEVLFVFQSQNADSTFLKELRQIPSTNVISYSSYEARPLSPSTEKVEELRQALARREIQGILFGSSEAVVQFKNICQQSLGEEELEQVLAVPVGVIGKKTATTAEQLGFHVRWQPPEPKFEKLVEVLGRGLLNEKASNQKMPNQKTEE